MPRLQLYVVRWIEDKEIVGFYLAHSIQSLGDTLDGDITSPHNLEFGRVNTDHSYALDISTLFCPEKTEDGTQTIGEYRRKKYIESVKAWFGFYTHWRA